MPSASLRLSLQEKANREAEERKRAGQAGKPNGAEEVARPSRLTDFPEIKEGERWVTQD